MLTSTSSVAELGARVDGHLVLAPGVVMERLVRCHLIADARYLGPFRPTEEIVVLWLVAEGVAELHAERAPAAAAYLLDTDAYDAGEGALTVRGARSVVLEMRLDRSSLGPRLRDARAPVVLADDLVACIRDRWRDATDARFVLDALTRDGLLAPHVAERAATPIPESSARVWAGLAKAYGGQQLMVDHVELAASAPTSLRTFQRELQHLFAWAHLPIGLRATLRGMRIRRAALLLSAPEGTVARVARKVGYGSPDALARALRLAGLPSPSTIRATALSFTETE